jgi:AcrR family transcriptional regulator
MVDTPKRRGRYAVGLARRAQIIEAAVRHFARYGYGRSSIGRVAREVGISEAGLLHHFASKQELLLEVLRQIEEADRAALAAADLPTEGIACLQRLPWVVDHNVNRPGLVGLFVRLSAEATGEDHPARPWFAQRYRRLVTDLAAGLRAGVTRGEIRSDLDCEGLARELAAVSDGLQIQWLLGGCAFDLGVAYRDYVARVHDQIAAPAGLRSTADRPG